MKFSTLHSSLRRVLVDTGTFAGVRPLQALALARSRRETYPLNKIDSPSARMLSLALVATRIA